jgi:hypothetical protein
MAGNEEEEESAEKIAALQIKGDAAVGFPTHCAWSDNGIEI